jgi:hypothetical protein
MTTVNVLFSAHEWLVCPAVSSLTSVVDCRFAGCGEPDRDWRGSGIRSNVSAMYIA